MEGNTNCKVKHDRWETRRVKRRALERWRKTETER